MAIDAGLLAVGLWLVAFAGGALGSALGGYTAYGLSGVVVTLGELWRLVAGEGASPLVASGPVEPLGAASLVGYGPVLGPHVAFAGGVAGAAYAGRKGLVGTDFEYHQAKDLTRSAGLRPRVALVGGVFGLGGYGLAQLSIALALPWDPVAASVVVSGLAARVAFGYPLVGSPPNSFLDMSLYRAGQRRSAAGGESPSASLAARYVVEPWMPSQSEWPTVTAMGAVAGVAGAALAVGTGSYMLAFGIPAAALLLVAADVEGVPVVHHMAFPAALAALALPEAAVAVAVGVGGTFGVVGGLVGELAQRLLYAHADTHLDPPSASMAVTTALVALLDVVGVFEQAAVPTLGL